MILDLALGASGVTLTDLNCRLYAGASPRPLPSGLALAAMSTGVDYSLSGLPDYGAPWTLTMAREGVGFLATWNHPAEPEFLIIPVRDPGLSATDLELVVTKNGAVVAGVSLAEIGSPGDYLATGWSAPLAGERWMMRYASAGVYFSKTWTGSGAKTALAGDAPETIERRLLADRLATYFLGVDRLSTLLCPVAVPGISFDPRSAASVAPFTVDQVAQTTGYIQMAIQVLDAYPSPIVRGPGPLGDMFYTESAVDLTVRVPRTEASIGLQERYIEALRDCFWGFRATHNGAPSVFLEQRREDTPRILSTKETELWRETRFRVIVRREESRTPPAH